MHPFYLGHDDAHEVMILAHDETHRANSDRWHTDVTFLEKPPQAAVLYAEQIPELGGDTLWANMYLAYETLSEPIKTLVTQLRAIHSFAKNFTPERFKTLGIEDRRDQMYAKHPPVSHPVARTNPATGRRALFVNQDFTSHIEGISPRESDALLRLLFEHMERPEFQVRWRWNEVRSPSGTIAGRNTARSPITFQIAASFVARRSSANGPCKHVRADASAASDVALIVMGSVVGSGISARPRSWRSASTLLRSILLRVGGRRTRRTLRRLHPRRARRAPSARVRYLRLLARRVSSGRRVRLRLDLAARVVQRRPRSGGRALRGILHDADGLSHRIGLLAAIALAALARCELPGRSSGRQRPERINRIEARRFDSHRRRGLAAHPALSSRPPLSTATPNTLAALSFAMIPVLFTYNGAMVANFMATEVNARQSRSHSGSGWEFRASQSSISWSTLRAFAR